MTPYFCGSGASENQQKSSDSNILKKISGGFSNIFSSKPNDKNTEISCDRNAMKKVKDLERLKSRTTVLDTYIGLIIANWMWHFSDDKSVQEVCAKLYCKILVMPTNSEYMHLFYHHINRYTL